MRSVTLTGRLVLVLILVLLAICLQMSDALAQSTASQSSPANNSHLPVNQITFEWSGIQNPGPYRWFGEYGLCVGSGNFVPADPKGQSAMPFPLRQISSHPESILFCDWVGSATSKTFNSFPNDGTTYSWFVAAYDAQANWDYYQYYSSPVWSFVNGKSVPDKTVLSSPADYGTDSGTSVTFSWASAANAEKYHIQVFDETGDLFAEKFEVTGTSTSFSNFCDDGSVYSWKVRAWNATSGHGPFSDTWQFTNTDGSTICVASTGSGIGVLGNTRPVNTCRNSELYYLKDKSRGVEIATENSLELTCNQRRIMTDLNNSWIESGQAAGVDAHVNTGLAYDYLKNSSKGWSLNSYDGRSPMKTVVNISDYDSAYWVGNYVEIGRGIDQGGKYLPFSGSLSFMAHEWGHAITDSIGADLLVEGEGGAINEAFSDWLGITIERANSGTSWIMGTGIHPTRNLANPLLSTSLSPSGHQPDYYGDTEYYWIPFENCWQYEKNDNCFIHWNNGPLNKMFYLLAETGPHTHRRGVTVQGIGIEKAMKIAFVANSGPWLHITSFQKAADGMITAAEAIHGLNSFEVYQVKNAGAAVGVMTRPKIATTVSPNLPFWVGGTTTGAGNYEWGSTATVTATPAAGFIFRHWTEDENIVSSEPAYSFIVDGNRNLVAKFAIIGPSILFPVPLTDFGTLFTVDSTTQNLIVANYGSEPLYIASADISDNQDFSVAPGDDGCSGRTLNYEQTCTIKVKFSPVAEGQRSATLTLQSNAQNGAISTTLNGTGIIPQTSYVVTVGAGVNGTLSPSGAVNVNFRASLSFTLLPDEGYHISSTTGCGGILSGNIYTTAPITSDCTITAFFSINTYNVTASAGNCGTITPTGSALANLGSRSVFTVTPNTGCRILSVTGCGGTLADNIYTTGTITADCSVTASFISTAAITINADSGGSITPSGTLVVDSGTSQIFTVTPDIGYRAIVSGCGGTLSGNTYSIGPVMVDCTVTATFVDSSYKQLTISKTGAGTGTVTSNSSGIHCGDSCTAAYTLNTQVMLTATPDPNVFFLGWIGACSGTSTCTVTLNEDKSATAVFSGGSVANWAKTYLNSVIDRPYSVQQTGDGEFIVAGTSNSQAWIVKVDKYGEIVWQKTYGGSGLDLALAIEQTSDGGFIVAGATQSLGRSDDAWVLKLNANGDIEEQKKRAYGENTPGAGGAYSREWITSIHQAPPGNYIAAGGQYSNGQYFPLILKLDSNLDILWQKKFPAVLSNGQEYESFYSVQLTPEGQYLVAGRTSNGVAVLFKLDESGNIHRDANGHQWVKGYGSDNSHYVPTTVKQIAGGAYVMAGYKYKVPFTGTMTPVYTSCSGGSNCGKAHDTTWQFPGAYLSNSNTMYLQFAQGPFDITGKLATSMTVTVMAKSSHICGLYDDCNLTVNWSRIGTPGNFKDAPNNKRAINIPISTWTSPWTWLLGLYALGNSSYDIGEVDYKIEWTETTDAWVMKVDATGNVIDWQRAFKDGQGDQVTSIQQTSDGYIIGGRAYDPASSGPSVSWISKLDRYGNVLWQKSHDGYDSSHATLDYGLTPSVTQTADGGYVMASYTNFLGSPYDGVLMLKLDSNGHSGQDCTILRESSPGIGGSDAALQSIAITPTNSNLSANQPGTSVNSAGAEFYTICFDVLSPPLPPSDLDVWPAYTSQINLAWTNNADSAMGVTIERKVGSGEFLPIKTVAANVVSYSDTGLIPGETYSYRISAYNEYGTSGYCKEASAVPVSNPLPDIKLTPTSWDFGGVVVGNTSQSKTFTVSNIGTHDLVVGTFSLVGESAGSFSIPSSSNTCSGRTLAPHSTNPETCTFAVFFSPFSGELFTSVITIPSNDGDAPQMDLPVQGRGQFTFTYNQTGTGVGSFTINPDGLSCGNKCRIFDGGTVITLTSIPNEDSFWVKWSGGTCPENENPCNFVLNAATAVTGIVDIKPPISDFSAASTVVGILPFVPVTFTDDSKRAFNWYWDFGDPTSPDNTSILDNPTHIFKTVGKYTVSLVVSNTSGTDTKTITNYITVEPCPNLPVRVVHPGGSTVGYTTLQQAYDEAVSGDSIQALNLYLAGGVDADKPKDIVISGGFSCDYQNQIGVTDIDGQVIISDGTLTIADVNLVSGQTGSVFQITATATHGGSISPSGTSTALEGTNMTFTITPDPNYFILDVLVNGDSVGAVNSYTYTGVAANSTIEARFSTTYTISAIAGPNGVISPAGDTTVVAHHDQAYTITPDVGYHVADVLVDGISAGIVSSYTFTDTTRDHTISVSFAINTYTISASAGLGGNITPSGEINVNHGTSKLFTMTADTANGYSLLDVLVDGVSVGPVNSYTLSNVTAPQTIRAVFSGTLTITKTGSGTGLVSSATGSVSCGTTCSAEYLLASNVTLTAIPDANSVFTGWSAGGCSGTGSCLVTMNMNTTVNAIFNLKPPVPDFSCTVTTGVQTVTTTCTDLSTLTPTSWLWEFGDGTTSTLNNPTHTYNMVGTYTVKLTATNAGGGNTITKTGYVVVQPYVKISGSPTVYRTIQEAYDAASTGATIQVRNLTVIESLDANAASGKAITVEGGYDPTFAVTSGVTTLNGSISITTGNVTVKNFILQK